MQIRQIINIVLKKSNLSAIIRRDKLTSYLTFEVIDFLDREGKYKSIELVYNDTTIFRKNHILLGSSSSENLTDYLLSTVKTFDSKEDYIKNKKILPSKLMIEQVFENYLHEVNSQICQCATENFKVRGVEMYTNPTTMVFIDFNFKKKRQPTLRFFLGQENMVRKDYGEYEQEYISFIEQINELIGGLVWV